MIQNDIEQLIRPTVESMGYELWGCEYLAQGKHSLLRVYIDKPEGVGVDDCQTISHQISALLDVDDPIPGQYCLEVSSPGVPRPLFHKEHYQRYVGLSVQIKLFRPIIGMRKCEGVIVSADDKALVLMLNHGQQDFLFSNIVKANLTV